MTRIRFDQLAKQYLEAFLEPLGTVQRNLEVPGESKFVDVWFMPGSESALSAIDLGLLSRITTTPCLLEPYHHAPTRQEVRSCLLKLLWLQEDQRRKTEQNGFTPMERDLPSLWLLAATVTKPVIVDFGGQPRSDWLPGIYFLPEANKTAIVVIDELPQTEETLWIRILGRAKTQRQAISELLALPVDDARRSRVLQLLVVWKVTIEGSEAINDEDQALMATLSQAYLEWERQTEERGMQQGAEREARSLILRLLNRRVGDLPDSLRSQINELSLNQLESLGEALLDFTSLPDLKAWLVEQGR